MCVDGVAVVCHIGFETFAGEVPPPVPVGIIGFGWGLVQAGLLVECFPASLAIAGFHAPHIPVDPESVHLVAVDQFQQLWNHELVGIGTARAHFLTRGLGCVITERCAGNLAIGLDDAPGGMLFAGGLVPDAGIVAMEREPELAGGLTPLRHGILDHAGGDGGVGHLAEPAGHAGMTLAVGLDKIHAHHPEHGDQFPGTAPGAEFGVLGAGVQVVVQAEVAAFAVPLAGCNGAGSGWCFHGD